MSIASDFFAPALNAEPTPKIAAPSPMARLREILSLTLPASMPVKAEGTRMIFYAYKCPSASAKWSGLKEDLGSRIHRDDETADERRELAEFVLERLHLCNSTDAAFQRQRRKIESQVRTVIRTEGR